MKGQREFQLLIADIRDALSDVARESRYGDLFHATWQLVRFEGELAGDIGKVRELIAVARAIRNATGPGRSVAEQKIMDTLKGIAWTCSSVLEQDGVPRIPDLAAADGLIPDLRRSMLVVAELRDYALESLRFNARPRDAFAGARRGQSFIHAALLTVAETTDSRPTATGALNVLVETGEISDVEALDRLDDWKDKPHHIHAQSFAIMFRVSSTTDRQRASISLSRPFVIAGKISVADIFADTVNARSRPGKMNSDGQKTGKCFRRSIDSTVGV